MEDSVEQVDCFDIVLPARYKLRNLLFDAVDQPDLRMLVLFFWNQF